MKKPLVSILQNYAMELLNHAHRLLQIFTIHGLQKKRKIFPNLGSYARKKIEWKFRDDWVTGCLAILVPIFEMLELRLWIWNFDKLLTKGASFILP